MPVGNFNHYIFDKFTKTAQAFGWDYNTTYSNENCHNVAYFYRVLALVPLNSCDTITKNNLETKLDTCTYFFFTTTILYITYFP